MSKAINIKKLSGLAHKNFNKDLHNQLGFGFLTGYCSGYCLSKALHAVAFALGAFVISVQTLSYNGYMKVNMGKLERDVDRFFDYNKDGKVDGKDIKAAYEKVTFE